MRFGKWLEIIHEFRAVIMIAFASFCVELGFSIVSVSTLPVFIDRTLHSTKLVGVVLGVFYVSDTIFRPVLGAIGDKYGRRWLITAGPILSAATSAITVYINVWVLIFLRFVDGIASAALWPSVFAAAGDVIGPGRRATAMSIINVSYMSGLALGPLIGGLATDYLGYRFRVAEHPAFLIAALAFMLGVVVAFIAVPRAPGIKHGEVRVGEASKFKISDLNYTLENFAYMIVIAAVVFLAMGLIAPVAKLYAMSRYHMSETMFGYILAPIAVFLGLVAVPIARFTDVWGERKAVFWGIALSAASVWLITYGPNVVFVIIGSSFLGLGFVVAFPAWLALISDLAPENRRGEVIGVIGFAQGVGILVGAALSGFLYGSSHFSLPTLELRAITLPFFSASILLSLSAMLSFIWIYRDKDAHAAKLA